MDKISGQRGKITEPLRANNVVDAGLRACPEQHCKGR
jgi:hypothetical protein